MNTILLLYSDSSRNIFIKMAISKFKNIFSKFAILRLHSLSEVVQNYLGNNYIRDIFQNFFMSSEQLNAIKFRIF